ncbi:RagB/SusD family nutrient uptake outer membrane protein [Deminuibacter soli]|uniref:RagB/SusD family nutrient uptake outer membrane protein n=1 Tax=Deminuibacter soli TaxID=2291815 RepID=A0A3E1NG21_9BACT|nr:RagB/SusD family nutrient uptake outer membrane protein [Deminuibacter soli]RFM26771.1 RagB/SusD family nutrient uptake outer membrane protein [Deminuibacter soli]
MKKRTTIYISAALLMLASCKKALDYTPAGVLSSADLTSATAAEGLVTAAYAAIGNGDPIGPIFSKWAYGSVRSDDAYKGGGGTGDQVEVDQMEHYNTVTPTMGIYINRTWTNYYKSISRANVGLRAVNALSEDVLPKKKVRQAELRFLRGHSFFSLKQLYKNIPIFDETATNDDILKVSNDLSNDAAWDKIAADFEFAAQNLPETQSELGRANKYAAEAYLAKVRLYQAYEQDDRHQVVNINQGKLQQVVSLLEDVVSSGKYSLAPDISDNFLPETENGPESVFAIQFTINDGTINGRLDYEEGVTYPSGAPQYGCCGFHMPSQNMVNAFTTDANGLPNFNTFNNSIADFTAQTFDVRVDHTVGVDGHPYKYDPTTPFSNSWIRDPGVYGNFHSMRTQLLSTSSSYYKLGPFMGSALNVVVIRYDDVLLMLAEAYIETGQQDKALPLINRIRARAAASTARLKKIDGTFATVYNVKEYPGTGWTQDYARKALQWERRLEFATEGSRFFDLVRWGIAEPTLNAYINVEKNRRTFLATAKFTAGRDEYLPIPQAEITFTKGLYKQNPGY